LTVSGTAHNAFHIEEGKDAGSVMRLRAAGMTLNFSRTGTDAPATQRASKMFIHYHFRRRADSRVLNAAADTLSPYLYVCQKHF
jgi:hypothetical protein